MITSIILNNFKGRTETIKLDRYNLFCGINGSGKSAIPEAFTLARTGYVQGVKRQNREIFRIMFFGHNNPLPPIEYSVGFVFKADEGEVEFKREFSTDNNGKSVAQEFFVSGKKVSKDRYNEAMVRYHVPGVFDIEAFMEFSDEKKINAIFERFGDLDDDIGVDSKIDAAKAEINRLNSLIKVNTGVTQRLSVTRAGYELPDGSLAEVNTEIEKVAAELKLANQHLTKLRIKEAKKEKEDEMLKKEEETKQAAQEIFGGGGAAPTGAIRDHVGKDSPLNEGLDAIDESYLNDTDTERHGVIVKPIPSDTTENDWSKSTPKALGKEDELSPRNSIQKIILAIKSVGCVLCSNGAGIMVAKSELKKYEVNNETD